jgi:hypothetical protein
MRDNRSENVEKMRRHAYIIHYDDGESYLTYGRYTRDEVIEDHADELENGMIWAIEEI